MFVPIKRDWREAEEIYWSSEWEEEKKTLRQFIDSFTIHSSGKGTDVVAVNLTKKLDWLRNIVKRLFAWLSTHLHFYKYDKDTKRTVC